VQTFTMPRVKSCTRKKLSTSALLLNVFMLLAP
jgi:hypothetical protein